MDTEYYDRNPYDKALTNSRINEIINVISTKKSKGLYLAPLEENLFIQITDMEKRIKRNSFSFLADSCLFDSRIYVDTDGNFHICEKMNDQFPFGDYQKGFDFPKMKRIALEFIELIKKNCRDCEARFLCIRCYIHFAKEGKFEISTEFCDMNKKSINKLEKLIQLKEKGVL